MTTSIISKQVPLVKKPPKVGVVGDSRITPFLMFNANPEEAAKFYVSVFKNSKILSANSMQATFVLDGQKFYSFHGGPRFQFSEGVSFFVSCDTQSEVDSYWEKLTSGGGAENMCGWLKDKYGLSWQIIPKILTELLGHKDREKANRATKAMLQMKKISIQGLQDAVNN